MSAPITKEDVIKNKKESIKCINKMLEGFINDPTEKHLKKANLISYWLKDYVKMIGFDKLLILPKTLHINVEIL